MALPVGQKAIDLIVAEEIGSPGLYTARYQHPGWPGGGSGVTIGIGYDLGQHTADQIRADWSDHLSPDDVESLVLTAGLKGEAANTALIHVRQVVVPIAAAMAVFSESTLPKYAAGTEGALSNCDALTSDGFGVLVSIGYNRGNGGWNADDDRHQEMADISDAMDARAFGRSPGLILSMRRLWAVNSDLWNRRTHEADLFKEAQGL